MEEVFTFQPRNSENTEFTLAITWAVSKLELYAVCIYRSLYDFSKASEQSLSMVKAFRNFTFLQQATSIFPIHLNFPFIIFKILNHIYPRWHLMGKLGKCLHYLSCMS